MIPRVFRGNAGAAVQRPRFLPNVPALVFLLAGVFPASVPAHPHAWIDLRVSLVFGPRGDLQLMQQEWAFDPSYSQLILRDQHAMEPEADVATALRGIRERLLARLRDHDYFTEMAVGTQPLTVPDAQAANLDWRDRRLHFRFELPLDVGRPQTASAFTYRVYDPAYWIEVLHDPDDVIHLGGAAASCEARLDPPRPEGWLVAYAASLDRQQRAPIDNLGRSFAERVVVQCLP